MRSLIRLATAIVLVLGATTTLGAQPFGGGGGNQFPVDDPILRQMWAEGMDRSQTWTMMQVLTDSIGPRLTGSPGMRSANDWLVAMYGSWGVTARNEQYGTWRHWRRGVSHIDLMAPRVRSLEGMMLAWSPGTPRGQPVTAETILIPDLADSAAFRVWLPQVRGKMVLVSGALASCRPLANLEEFALPATLERMRQERQADAQAWNQRIQRTGHNAVTLPRALEDAGAVAVVTSQWSNGWGVNKIFQARTTRVPTVELSCEDYGLVYRLTDRGQGARLRITADAEFGGEQPVFNTIAEIRGTEKPDEYIMLSAHLDSWDGSSGATDNATGTIVMLEAIRILRQHYPNPKRTILVGHWNGEEQGLNGSRAFAEDHPEVVNGLHALFNQDNGTGRVVNVSASGLVGASANLANYFARLPSQLSNNVRLGFPGSPAGGGSDHASFVCRGAPGFSLSSLSWDYGTYTWHTNRDTFDKVVFDDVKMNATMTAMLVYLAAEDPDPMPRDRRVMPLNQQGNPTQWPACPDAARRTP
jgi:carboxypeptidase Q